MSSPIELIFNRRPSLSVSYLQGLLWPRHGIKNDQKIPHFLLIWENVKLSKKRLEKFNALCGLPLTSSIPILYPQTLVFPLVMRIISHKKFPFLYVSMLQLRNHIIYHKQIDVDETVNISSEIVSQRFVKRGIEIDIQSIMRAKGGNVWENINTYFFPCRSTRENSSSDLPIFSALAEAKQNTEWHIAAGGGWHYARISGDYNGIHYNKYYARIMGFKRDFIHPHRLISYCVNELPKLNNNKPIRLDAAFKGPVYYNNKVTMRLISKSRDHRFDLYSGDNTRPSICVDIKSAKPGSRLL
jgi:hypothetical protein